jgi:hypothetical protein
MNDKKNIRVGSHLAAAYKNLLNLHNVFRQRVCEECGWSEATFYRYLRQPMNCSKAERNSIEAIFNQVLSMYIDTPPY